MDLIELRTNIGGQLEYRSKLACVTEADLIENVPTGEKFGYLTVSLNKWGPWKPVPAVKGDASDQERWG